MRFASSLYKGGQLIAAEEGDYSSSKELGLICPFCKESVFLVAAYIRGNSQVSAAWHHYAISTQSFYCENRALSKEGKELLIKLQPESKQQRLSLFNKRFWDIFKHKKGIPKNFQRKCADLVGKKKLEQLSKHCFNRWDSDAIVNSLSRLINHYLSNTNLQKDLQNHPLSAGMSSESIDCLVENFSKANFTVLRHKILSEVIEWLGTQTAFPSFEKLVCLSFIDCLEIANPPIHTQLISDMLLISLLLTDWEDAIASLSSSGIGFGK